MLHKVIKAVIRETLGPDNKVKNSSPTTYDIIGEYRYKRDAMAALKSIYRVYGKEAATTKLVWSESEESFTRTMVIGASADATVIETKMYYIN